MPPRSTATQKRCKDCGEIKPVEEFYLSGNRTTTGELTNARQPRCKPCHMKHTIVWKKRNPDAVREITRRANIKRLYGLTADQFEQLLAEQNGGCAICGREADARDKEILHVDHDSQTKKVRGLLCTSCNQGLGRFSHSPDTLRDAATYLETYD